MPERPLLIFPIPSTTARQKIIPRPFDSPYHFPDFVKQKERLKQQFESLRQFFIVNAADGLEPEYVLVIETIGKIDDFQRAARHIPGLEWLAEVDEEEIESDENFYSLCKIGKKIFYDNIE